MENVIEIGDTVDLAGTKYLVVATQIVGGVVIPLAVKSIYGSTVNSYTHRDSGGSWAAHHWEIIKKGTTTVVDKKAAIIAKVLYLDKKFKDKQALKSQLETRAATYQAVTGEIISSRSLDYSTEALHYIRANYTTTTTSW